MSQSGRIYMAGPLFTAAERQWNAALATALRELGRDVHLPQEAEAEVGLSSGSADVARRIFDGDVRGLDTCSIVVACMDGSDPDSGTCWECGYAYAKGKRVITYRTDMRALRDPTGAEFNLMITESSEVLTLGPEPWTFSPMHLAARIHAALG